MNSLEEYFSAIEAREKACVDLTASAGDIPNLVKLVRKYREALEQIGGQTTSYDVAKLALDALKYDPRTNEPS